MIRNEKKGYEVTGIVAAVESWEAVCIFLGTGLMASIMAFAFTSFRKIVYHDQVAIITCLSFTIMLICFTEKRFFRVMKT